MIGFGLRHPAVDYRDEFGEIISIQRRNKDLPHRAQHHHFAQNRPAVTQTLREPQNRC